MRMHEVRPRACQQGIDIQGTAASERVAQMPYRLDPRLVTSPVIWPIEIPQGKLMHLQRLIAAASRRGTQAGNEDLVSARHQS